VEAMTTVALEQEVFDKLYREFHPRVLAICRQMLGSVEQAEEAANDVFARLPSAIRSYDPAQSFARWISRVATNYCVDLLRKRRAEQRVLEPAGPALPEPVASARSPLSELLNREEAGAVRDALVRLPERYFVPVVMHYFSDLSYNQIAESLGTTRASVAVLIFRGKQKLRRILSETRADSRAISKAPSREDGCLSALSLGAFAAAR
jgi:RNA polymerase sigma-70 factor, ECF subfamily